MRRLDSDMVRKIKESCRKSKSLGGWVFRKYSHSVDLMNRDGNYSISLYYTGRVVCWSRHHRDVLNNHFNNVFDISEEEYEVFIMNHPRSKEVLKAYIEIVCKSVREEVR